MWILSILLLSMVSQPSYLQQNPVPDVKPSAKQAERVTELMAVARDSGQLYGLGRYCNLDPVLLEEFLVASQARINALSDNSQQRVIARIQFENQSISQGAKGPPQGCEALTSEFRAFLRSLR